MMLQHSFKSGITCSKFLNVGEQQLLAVGLANGTINLYDPIHDKIGTVLDGQCGAVTSCCWCQSSETLFTGHSTGLLVAWNVNDSSSEKWNIGNGVSINEIFVEDSHLIASIGTQIKIISVESKETIMTLHGHGQIARCLVDCSNDGMTIISSQGDRHINCHSVDLAHRKHHTTTMSIDTNCVSINSGHGMITAIDENGQIHVNKSLIKMVDENNQLIPLVFAQPTCQDQLLIIRSGPIVVCEEIIVDGTDQILSRSSTDSLFQVTQHESRNARSDNVLVVGTSHEALSIVETIPSTIESSFGEQLMATKESDGPSMAMTLNQAIKSGDGKLLEEVLQICRGGGMIESTIRKVPTSLVFELLQQLVIRIESKPIRTAKLLVWIKNILVIHMAHLLTIPKLNEQLSRLYKVIESRTMTFDKLLCLDGKLDLILSQLSIRRDDETEHVYEEAEHVYEDE